jgi:hypothetical protein
MPPCRAIQKTRFRPGFSGGKVRYFRKIAFLNNTLKE